MTVAIMEIVAISPLQTLAELKPSQKPARLSIRKSLTINKDLLLKDALNRASLGEGIKDMAEAVRFELTEGANPRRFSRPLPSTTRPRFHRSARILDRRNQSTFWRASASVFFVGSEEGR
jgi:hypothetical protein